MSEETQSPVEATEDEFAPTAWGSDKGVGTTHSITVPSGQKALVLRPGVAGLIEADILHNVDALTALVKKHIDDVGPKKPQDRRKKGKKQEVEIDTLLKDQQAMRDVLEVVNKAMVKFVIKPKVLADPEDVADREEGNIYVSMIDINDRMFLFNFMIGGSPDLTSFREGLQEVVGSLEAEQGVQDEAE